MKLLLICLGCLALPAAVLGQEPAAWEGKTLAQWVEQLADQDVRVRWYAIYALGQIGPPAAEAAGPLAKLLEDQYGHEHVRGAAAWALGRIGPGAQAAVPLLTTTLTSKHLSVRRNSTLALGAMGIAAKTAVPGLLPLLEDEDATVRVHAALALWQIDRYPKSIPTLAAMLREGSGAAAYEAAGALGQLGADAEPAVPALIDALAAAEPDLRRNAARALGHIGAPAASALKKALEDPNPQVCVAAVEALGWMGEAAVPELTTALASRHAPARRAAARALGRLGPKAKSAESALVETVNDADNDVRQAAAKALRQIRAE